MSHSWDAVWNTIDGVILRRIVKSSRWMSVVSQHYCCNLWIVGDGVDKSTVDHECCPEVDGLSLSFRATCAGQSL